MVKKASKRKISKCPINLALAALGDRWTLLVIRDLMFKKRRTFKDFLNAEEGISSNILSDRLFHLESLEIVSKEIDSNDTRRVIYRLTKRGIELAPVMVEIVLWSARNFDTEAPQSVVRQMTHQKRDFLKKVFMDWKQGQQ